MNFEIKQLGRKHEINRALHLAEEVFAEFEAPDYPAEGINSFREFLYGERLRKLLEENEIIFFGAFEDNELIGMCAIRNKSHIALLFVNGKYHRKGIGKALFYTSCKFINKLYGTRIFTVNSSSYGLPFYLHLGFIPTDMERLEDGILYTPMIYSLTE